MEAKNQTFIWRNSSYNSSQAINSTRREYVFAPVNSHVKLAIFTAMLILGLYGMITNFLILYFKHKQQQRSGRRQIRERPFTSRSLILYFVRSLCLSDILCSLVSLPLYSAEMFVNFVNKDCICRLTRFLITFFPVITVLNLLVIGIERYATIFHPFSFLRQSQIKKMVLGAWILAVLITLTSTGFVRMVRYDIGEDFYTLVCKYDSSVQLYQALFTGFILISYIIPSFILTLINLRILKRQRKSKAVDSSQNTQRAISRLKVTRMFVSLIFAFIFPYMAFVVYSSFRAAVKIQVSFTDDYVVRYISASLIFANGAVSATILIYYEKLYLEFWTCFRSSSTRNHHDGRNAARRLATDPKKNAVKFDTSSV